MVGDNIAKFRERKNWTQRDLARRADMSYSVLSRIESGKRPVNDQELNLFSDLLDVSADQLLGRSSEMNYKGVPISEAEREMLDFFNDPDTGLFFKEMKEAPKDQLEEMRQIWEVLKRRGLK